MNWLLGLPKSSSIENIDLALAAPWAQSSSFWIAVGIIVSYAAGLLFYHKFQPRSSIRFRNGMGIVRGSLLAILFLTLANPVLRIRSTSTENPLVYVLFDGTESMALEDPYTTDEASAIRRAIGEGTAPAAPSTNAGGGAETVTRLDAVRSIVANADRNPFEKLVRDKKVEVHSFSFSGSSTNRLRPLDSTEAMEKWDGERIAKQLEARGDVTAIGTTLDEVRQQPGASRLAGVVLVSDFAQNSGPPPLGAVGTASPATRLRVPLYTIGIGATQVTDLAIDLQVDPKMKRAERSTVSVKLRQSGLEGKPADVTVLARRLQTEADASSAEIVVGRKTVSLTSIGDVAEFPFVPQDAGLFEFVARVEPIEGEVVVENNQVSRQVNIIDDYLRLMYVAYEPTWEWRFVKEVFHRDKLVGMDGFRTFLSSSDPRVRQANVLFLPTLTPQRSEFFKNDVLFLGDMPRSSLSSRFQEMVEEFVRDLGGGLVVISGPRFGPRELAGTRLADMLPVVVDNSLGLRDGRPFVAKRTAHAERYPFMRLGETDGDNQKAWSNLGEIPWYQPVAALHQENSFALAEHPSDKCADGKTPQPLIAIRQYGRGEVVYLAFDEMWRLRRKFGEKHYRQFWSQLIYRLGMSHALGDAKRFVVGLDRQEYRVDDKAILTVEGYDENYEPMREDSLSERSLTAEILAPEGVDRGGITTVKIPMLRPGTFETQIPLRAAGTYSIRVRDPVTGNWEERRVDALSLSAERRRPMRDLPLQQALARETDGRSYELSEVSRLADDIQAKPTVHTATHNRALWSTPLWFGTVILLMLFEWFTRKLVRLV